MRAAVAILAVLCAALVLLCGALLGARYAAPRVTRIEVSVPGADALADALRDSRRTVRVVLAKETP